MKKNVRERRDIMLCYPFSEKRLLTYPKPWCIQPKLEGDRCRAVWDPNIGYVIYSSSGLPMLMLPHITKALNDLNIKDELDGELYNLSLKHEKIHGIVSRSKNLHKDHELVQFHIFDTVNPNPFWMREAHLLGEVVPSEYIRLVPTYHIYELEQFYEMYEHFLDLGYEGIIVRNPMGDYLRCPTRSRSIMKLKPREVMYAVCTAIYEETSIEGEPKGILGKIQVRDSRGKEFKVGTGFKHEQKVLYWNMPQLILGHVVKIHYQSLTRNGIPKMSSIKEVLDD